MPNSAVKKYDVAEWSPCDFYLYSNSRDRQITNRAKGPIY